MAMFIQQNESLMKLGHAADADRDRIDRLWPLGPQILEAKSNVEALRQETAQHLLSLRDELNSFSTRVEQSAGQLIKLNMEFEVHVGQAFKVVQEECGNLRSAIMASGPSEHSSTSQLQTNLELAALRSATESMNARLTVAEGESASMPTIASQVGELSNAVRGIIQQQGSGSAGGSGGPT